MYRKVYKSYVYRPMNFQELNTWSVQQRLTHSPSCSFRAERPPDQGLGQVRPVRPEGAKFRVRQEPPSLTVILILILTSVAQVASACL